MKEKIMTGGNVRPRSETGAQGDNELPDENDSIVEVDSGGTAKVRKDLGKGPAQPRGPQSGTAVDDEDPDYSPMDPVPDLGKKREPGSTP